uniref:ShKT domain-containing protein n=1 Tax=Romanomermis culicivorax TaxID=13658 RepID=A0A915HVD2_ROMCU
ELSLLDGTGAITFAGPCEDIYNSCSVWKSENSCDDFRQKSSFFDTHCAKSCEMCSVDQNVDAAKFSGFPPLLEPLTFLLGKWVFNGTSLRRYPIDYTRREINQFLNQIEFIPCRPNMFRIPSLKYKFIGLSLGDSADSVVSQGFLYAMTAEDGVKVVLHASSNEGFITMEEGTLLADRVLELVTTVGIPFKDDPFLDTNLKKNIRRSFEIVANNYLRETIERMDVDDERIIYANYYQLKESYKPF